MICVRPPVYSPTFDILFAYSACDAGFCSGSVESRLQNF